MNSKFPVAVKLAVSLLLLFLCHVHAEVEVPTPSCASCDPSSCTDASELDCPSGTVWDVCGCCQICAKTVGQRCGRSSVCREDLLCIPDSPYSTSQDGTCQEATPCLTFGCDTVDGVCHCSYSNACPLREFTYITIEECEESLQLTSSCSYGNESFSHGDKWNLDSCTSCECNNGTLNCFQEPCSIASDCPSGRIFTPEGECCPVCSTECQASDGQIYSDGEIWQEGPCKRCRCDGGRSICSSVQCLAPDCPNPIFLPDECCPFCPEPAAANLSCTFGNEIFADGDTWTVDSCTTCECSNGNVNCIQQPCSIPDCPSGRTFTPEGECCPVCTTECQASDGQTYSDGDTWQEGPCKRCRCYAGLIKCSSVQCEHPNCSNPIFLPDVCCPICPEPAAATLSCTFGDEILADGDTWTVDSCTTCECSNGNVNCIQQACSIPDCPSGRTFTPEGECCPVCSTECQASDGQIYSDGDTWQEGPCKRCRCDGGQSKCSSVQCLAPDCPNPIFLPDECCPFCPELAAATLSCTFGDEIFADGDTWTVDTCTTCECSNGNVNCIQQPCSIPDCPSGRTFTPEGECCPVCSTECQASDGQIYSDGDTWQEGPCKRCHCDGGLTKCSSVQCEHPNCSNPIFLPDVCCPICPDEESSQPSPSSTPETLTSPPVTPDPNTEEVELVLDLPYVEYQNEERFLVAELRTLLTSEGLELVDMKATSYEDSSQTYIMMVLSSSDPEAVGSMLERVTNMMTANMKLMGTVNRVGTSSEVHLGGSSMVASSTFNLDREDRDSYKKPLLAAVLGTIGFVVVVSLVGISIAAVIFIRRRSRKIESEDKEKQ